MTSQLLFSSPRLRQLEAEYQAEPLMQRAGASAANWATELAIDGAGAILVCAGPGNNGGDAFEAAYLLRQRHFQVTVVFLEEPSRLPEQAAAAYQRFTGAGGSTVTRIPPATQWRLIIDGLFGIGLVRPAEGDYAMLIDTMNALAGEQRCPLLALDCPSGLNADTGQAQGTTICASHTLSFLAAKPGLYTADGPDHCGRIKITSLGLKINPDKADASTISPALFADHLHPRRQNSHKGLFGNVGILGGAHSMLGAVLLAGRAALHLGAGRVHLGLLAHDGPAVDPVQPELMIRKAESLFGMDLTALACGPGMGTSLQAAKLLEQALGLDLPLVLDADALNLLAFEGNLQTALAIRQAPTLLTPHPAEAARLLDAETENILADRIAAACEIAGRFHCHVALKGCGTVVADGDGHWWINTTGNPGMATAGTGDVLTGIALAFLAQGWNVEKATLAAIHLHGAAADELLNEGIGPIGLCAGEIIAPARRLLNQWIADAC